MDRNIRVFDEFKDSVQAEIKNIPGSIDLQKKIDEIAKDKIDKLHPLATDRYLYYFVICFLGLTIIVSLVCTFFLFYKNSNQQAIPEIFLALGSAAVGALAGLLAPNPK